MLQAPIPFVEDAVFDDLAKKSSLVGRGGGTSVVVALSTDILLIPQFVELQ